jgi:excinuclease ABC subunit C
MEQASAEMRFEEAAHLRDQLHDVNRTMEQQAVADPGGAADQDVLGLARQGNTVAVTVLTVRDGRVVGTSALTFADAEFPDDDVLLQVLDARAHHPTAPHELPTEVLLPVDLPEGEAEARARYLSDLKGRKVDLITPARGSKRRLVELATKNAVTQLTHHAQKAETRRNALVRLRERLRLSRQPMVMECFDVSLFQGAEAVASQVCFVEGQADKSRYRRFVIRSVAGTDDFAMIHEVLTRRLRRGGAAHDLPDLLVVDGGRGQLNAAVAAFHDVGVPISAQQAALFATQRKEDGTPRWSDASRWVDLCALAKGRALPAGRNQGYAGRKHLVQEAPDDEKWDQGGRAGASAHSPERVFLPHVKDPLALRTNSAELHLLTALRDEAHRFAVTFHRQRRKKRTLRSAIDEIPGIGAARRNSLLRHFGSLTALKAASEEQIAEVAGFSQTMARRVFLGLHPPLPAA